MSIAQSPSESRFLVEVVPDRHEVVVAPAGELDIASVDAFEREVRRLRTAGFDRVNVDLRRITFMDATGLGVLLALRDAATRDDWTLTLLPGPPRVQRVFDLTATTGLFDWRDRSLRG